jgi:hypothetical protein
MNRLLRFLPCALLLFSSCGGKHPSGEQMIRDQAFLDDLKLVAGARIYFGHQSVGANIVEGLREIRTEVTSAPLNLVTLGEPVDSSRGFLVHSQIGQNGKPETKCEDFGRNIRQIGAASVDIALMKFCFADFGEQTDVPAVFRQYTHAIDTLRREYPGITFIHVTAPLIQRTPWWKRIAKSILGRTDDTEIKNIKVNEFNELLTDHYRNEPIFDLARIESTAPDGTRYIVEQGGKKLYSIVSEYTSDGGHLNAAGRRIVATELIRTIGKVLKEKRG